MTNPPRALRKRARRQRNRVPEVVEYINPPPIRRRARPRRGRRNQPGGGGIMSKLVDTAMTLLGKGVGAMITGFGDYKIADNSIMTGGLDPPTVVNSVNNGGVIVRHREYLQDINASIPFNILTLPLNPGQITTFPWLSAIASHFEQYIFRGLLFEFKSLSSDAVLSAATSSALGSVVMATQYNALNPPFPNKFTMENYEFANSAKPSLSFIHPIECARKDTSIQELYVRNGPPTPGSDIRLYDLGNFNIATVGMQASVGVCGELWCTYEIELLKPKIENVLESSIFDHFTFNPTNNAQPFSSVVTLPGNTLGGALNNSTYTFPFAVVSGLFFIVWTTYTQPVTFGAITNPTRAVTNCNFVNFFANGFPGLTNKVSTSATGTRLYTDMSVVRITGASATVNWTLGTYSPTPTSGDFFVFELPSDVALAEEQEEFNSFDDSSDIERENLLDMIKTLTQRVDELKSY